ncbi:glycosyltransferase family 9 protein [Nonlabens antarcticus]|uniref:glycosyltransferase family 9 protein n=1 Tax=Nonlabens antarcticus TaxID=392714 RepID=UPI001E65055D|nr:glycosyltransferase family 9 protein [Nonlabens antarcticus]
MTSSIQSCVPGNKMQQPQRVLVMRLSAMGDVAMTIPVLLALRRVYSDLEISSLSRKRFFPIIQQVPGISIIEAKVDKQHKGILGLRRLAIEISNKKIDAVADVHNVLRTKVLRAFLPGTRKAVIDKGRREKKKLINDSDYFQQLKLTTQRYADVFEQLGLPIELTPVDILPRLPIPKKVHSLVGDHQHRWIGIAPFAAHKYKSLTPKKAKALVQAILEVENVKIVLLGGGSKEAKQLEIVAGTSSNVFNLAGFMSFEEELAMISNLDAMISMDSGNGHLAAMYGVPVITIWGNTHPFAGFVPFLQPDENQIIASREQFPLIPTSIYGNKCPEGYEKVLEAIECNAVVERLRVILEGAY